MSLFLGLSGRKALIASAFALFSLAAVSLCAPGSQAQDATTIPVSESSSETDTTGKQIKVARRWRKLTGAAASKGTKAYNRARRNREEEADGDEEGSEEEMMHEPPVMERPSRNTEDATPSPAPIKVQKATKRAEDDVYDAWAKKKIEREKAFDAAPHPLAKDHPDHFVVVCEAGCENGPAHIVYMELRNKRGPVDGTPADPDSPFSMGDDEQSNSIACVGGCYVGPTKIVAVPGGIADQSDPWSSESDDPTQKKSSEPSHTSKRWFQRIEREAAAH